MPLLRLGLHLGWLALSFALQTSSLVVPDVVCESFLGRWSCVFFLSSCWLWGWLLLSLFWCGFCASSLGACVFRGVSCRWLSLGVPQPFWLQLADLLLQWRLVVGLAVSLVHHLVFYLVLCSSFGACGWRHFPCRGLPLGGFSAFSVTGCLTYCHSCGVSWAATLPFFFLCFSCSG